MTAEGMNVVVTGSSTGIGRAITERLLSRGHQVWGLARSAQADLAACCPAFRFQRCDVSDWEQVKLAAAAVQTECSYLDALVTCAGTQGAIGRTLTISPSDWNATVSINLGGTFHSIRAFYPLLAKSKRRVKIVCFSGGGATKARPRFSAYGAAKTAIVRLVETIAEEERGSALDINAIAPGAVYTRLTEEILALGATTVGEAEFRSASAQKAQGMTPMARALDLVEWLLAPTSDRISGRLLSAQWDSWRGLEDQCESLIKSDLYTLRRVVPSA